RSFHEAPHLDKGIARFLKQYRSLIYTSGIVLAIGLLAGALAALGVGRARRSGMRSGSFMFAATAVCVFGSTVLANQFSYRYYVTLLTLLPPAGAIGLTALVRGHRPVEEPAREGRTRSRDPIPVRLNPQPGDSTSIPQANPG